MALPMPFPARERLKSRSAITRVFKNGEQRTCYGAKLFFLSNALDCNRIAFVFSRKFGNAVKRNRARRLGREAYRFIRHKLVSGFDMVLLMYPGDSVNLRFRQGQMESLLEKTPMAG